MRPSLPLFFEQVLQRKSKPNNISLMLNQIFINFDKDNKQRP